MASSSTLNRDLFILEDEDNPLGSKTTKILPSSILDQIYDNLDPTNKTLRTIIEELKTAIANGGNVVISFPVTSVNGQMGDVNITKSDVGLDNVDNTSDNEKPLSEPQRDVIMDILAHYDFNVNLDDLYKHLTDNNNPHHVTTEQINSDGSLTEFVSRLISGHNTNATAHADIRQLISSLANNISNYKTQIDSTVNNAVGVLSDHYEDPNAHYAIMNKKEDTSRKVPTITTSNTNYDNYPSVRAVVEYLTSKLENIENEIDFEHIKDIKIVPTRDQIPTASERHYRTAYFVIYGDNGQLGFSKCNKEGNEYSWEYYELGTYTDLDDDYFNYDRDNGLQVDHKTIATKMFNDMEVLTELRDVIKSIEEYSTAKFYLEGTDLVMEYNDEHGDPDLYIDEEGNLILNHEDQPIDREMESMGFEINGSFLWWTSYLEDEHTFDDYYTKDEIDAFGFLTSITITRGNSNGTIRYYTNGDMSTMSDDIPIAGLKKLAYMEKVTEEEIADGAVQSNHILDNAIKNNHMDDKSVNASNLTANYMTVFGNVSDDEHGTVQEIPINRLAELFVPVFRALLDDSDLIQWTEQAIRNLVKEEVRKMMDWDAPELGANFRIVGDDLILEYDDDYGTPNIYINASGDVILEEDESDISRVEENLEHFTFAQEPDYNLWLSIRE